MADTTPTLRESAQQALEALVRMTGVLNAAGWATGHADAAVKALHSALAEQAAEQAEPVPANCDVRTIMLDVVPGEDGHGHEVFATSVDDVLKKLSEMGDRLEQFELGRHTAPQRQPAEQAEPVAVPAGYAPEPDAIANHLARALFKLGGEPFGLQCCRIEFKVGTYPHDERTGGGFAEEPLAKFFASKLRELFAAPPAPARQEWQPIETAPKTGAKIIVRYVNRNNKPRTVMARWLTDEQAEETDADGVGLKGGWYECIDNWDDYTEVAIHEGEPSLWMPLPAAPITAAPAEGGAA